MEKEGCLPCCPVGMSLCSRDNGVREYGFILERNPTFCSMKFMVVFVDLEYFCVLCMAASTAVSSVGEMNTCSSSGWVVMSLFYGTGQQLVSLGAVVKVYCSCF